MSSQAGLHIYICCLFINHYKIGYHGFSLNITKHYLHKNPFQVLYTIILDILTYSVYYKHDLECTGKQHGNCLSVLKLKDTNQHKRYKGKTLKKGAFVSWSLGPAQWQEKCVVHQPGNSL